MSISKKMKLNSEDSILENECGDKWRKNWKEELKRIFYHRSDADTYHMVYKDIQTGEMRGIVKDKDEVVEVRYMRLNMCIVVELMVVNVKNHSMRVLTGLDRNELVEEDLSELKENETVDLSNDGKRWEGGVLKGEVFGYGCLYDEENQLEYEGWIIDGIKRCYGTEYWNDLGIVKYTGSWYSGMKHGYGVLYDRRGDIEHEGLFRNDYAFDIDTTIHWNVNNDLTINSYVESLIIDDDFTPSLETLSLTNLEMLLKKIEIGNNCFRGVIDFVIDGLNALESVKIGEINFPQGDYTPENKFMIMNCESLRELEIGERSFVGFRIFGLRNLPSLISVNLADYLFFHCHSVVFEGENDE